ENVCVHGSPRNPLLARRRRPLQTSALFPYTTLFRSPSSATIPVSPRFRAVGSGEASLRLGGRLRLLDGLEPDHVEIGPASAVPRSEEHTSELQSRENLVCRPLLEKKNFTRAMTAAIA